MIDTLGMHQTPGGLLCTAQYSLIYPITFPTNLIPVYQVYPAFRVLEKFLDAAGTINGFCHLNVYGHQK